MNFLGCWRNFARCAPARCVIGAHVAIVLEAGLLRRGAALWAGDIAGIALRGLFSVRPTKGFQFHKRFCKPSAAVSYGQKLKVWW